MSGTTNNILLSLRGVSKSFGATVALDAVDFDLRAGEIHAICGENGAGKSTLIKILAGVERLDAGEMIVGGRRIDVNSPSLALQNGVATIYQENSLFQYLSVAENIFLGDELRRLPGVVDRSAMLARARSLLDRLGASIDVGAPVSSLGGAGQKIVEIARAFRAQSVRPFAGRADRPGRRRVLPCPGSNQPRWCQPSPWSRRADHRGASSPGLRSRRPLRGDAK